MQCRMLSNLVVERVELERVFRKDESEDVGDAPADPVGAIQTHDVPSVMMQDGETMSGAVQKQVARTRAVKESKSARTSVETRKGHRQTREKRRRALHQQRQSFL